MYRTAVETKYVPPTGTSINVRAGDNLQAALNQAQPGQAIVLEAGATWTGNFVLPVKSGSLPVTIRPATLTAENIRVINQTGFPKILTPNAAPALSFPAGSNNWRLINVEVGIVSGVQTNYGIVKIGDDGISRLEDLPRNIIIDRCLIRGNDVGDCSRGVELNGNTCAVIDSSILNIHGIGFDTQAIGCWNGSGPFKIDNNYLEGAGENIMFGGADPKIAGLVPSDIQVTRNHCFKPLSWKPTDPSYAGKHWTVKNIFELKNAAYVLVEGNTFENNWVDGQDGTAILFTPRNQYGTAPWSAVQNVVFKNNEVINSPNGILILGKDYNSPSQQVTNIQIINNLFMKIGSRWLILSDTASGVQVERNTILQGGNLITLANGAQAGFSFKRNIAQHNEYGIIGDGKSPGKPSIDTYLSGATIAENVLVGVPEGYKASYPNNLFAANLAAIGFDSAYRPSGTYVDYGANIDAIEAAKKGTGQPPPPPPPPTPDIKARILEAATAARLQIANDKKLGATSKKHQLLGADKVISAIKGVN